MAETLVAQRDIAFLLYEVLDVEHLTERPRFAEHNRATFDAVLATARTIAERSFATHNRKSDDHEPVFEAGLVRIIPEVKAALVELAEAGFLAAHHDEALGGMQLPFSITNAAFAHFQGANVATASYAFLTVGAANMLNAVGSDELKRRYLPPMLDGRFFGTMALTEPQAGSSLADIRTKAEPAPDGTFRLSGTKIFISGGQHDLSDNIVHMVLAKIPGSPPGSRGISLFLVPKILVDEDLSLGAANGVALAGLIHKMGWRGTTSTILNFGEDRPCVGYLLGKPHQGLQVMFQMMNEARISVGMCATMLGYSAYLTALDYARTRPQGRLPGVPDQTKPPVALVEHPDIRRMLLAQKATVEGALALCLACARLVDDEKTAPDAAVRRHAGLLLGMLTPIAKAWPAEACQDAISHAIQIHGGYGFTRDYPVEQNYRDNRLNPIHEGTNGIQAIDLLGRKVRLDGGAGLTALSTEIRATIAEALALDATGELARALESALDRALATTGILLAAIDRSGPDRGLANASLYLDLMSRVVIGWIWLRQAIAAGRGLAKGADAAFYQGKLQAARYYTRFELPRVALLADLLDRLDDTSFTMQDGWF
jgi:alkylation response protein AidB-like acyl-CoA dehydrogenase